MNGLLFVGLSTSTSIDILTFRKGPKSADDQLLFTKDAHVLCYAAQGWRAKRKGWATRSVRGEVTVSRTHLPQALAKGKVISLWVNFSFFGCYSSKKAATLASLMSPCGLWTMLAPRCKPCVPTFVICDLFVCCVSPLSSCRGMSA